MAGMFDSRTFGLWTERREGEAGAPRVRRIHAQLTRYASPVAVRRIGVRVVGGFFKCGSQFHADWASGLEAYALCGDHWVKFLDRRDLPCPPWHGDPQRPPEGETVWLEPDVFVGTATAVAVEVRTCGADGFFPGYNVARWGVAVETEGARTLGEAPAPSLRFRWEEGRASGIRRVDCGATVTVETPFYRIECYKYLPLVRRFGIDEAGQGNYRDLLCAGTGYGHEENGDAETRSGFLFRALGQAPGEFLAGEAVSGPERTVYALKAGGARFELSLCFEQNRVRVVCRRRSQRELSCAEFADLRLCFDAAVSPACLLGKPVRTGRAGRIALPAVLHVPAVGSLTLTGSGCAALDSMRMKGCVVVDLRTSGENGEHGEWVLPPGEGRGELCLTVGGEAPVALREDAPPDVRRAVSRYAYCCLPYRADIDSLVNNGNSIHAYLCMDNFAFMQRAVPALHVGVGTQEFLLHTLEHWLDGMPSYASGNLCGAGHRLEEEYLLDLPSCLLGLALAAEDGELDGWLSERFARIADCLARALALDADGDGLLESSFRRGISGEHQWSTNWFDVISFGHKDAFVNAIFYEAIDKLAPTLGRIGRRDWAERLRARGERLRSAYHAAFYVPDKRRFASWRSADGEVHDYGFLFVNGAAVRAGLTDRALGRDILSGLYRLLTDRFPLLETGLPGNLEPIPACDMALPQFTFGQYQNGSLTLSQSRHFLEGLYAVGLEEEADQILSRLARGLNGGTCVGGVGSGGDWQTPQGLPCGYEGILSDQFGAVALMIERYRARNRI